jgi:hypothetical protein
VGRSSDTRQRTREAAAELVAGGHRAYAITVDLIYAAIGQGSRTTINDELKRWKDEQARAAALEADWPPVVADGMRALWVLAVEHGERVFEQRRAEVEAQLATAHEELARAESARAQLLATQERVSEQVGTLSEHLAEVRQQLRAETAAKNDAVAHAHALQEELNAARQDSARQLESIRQEQEKQAADFQQAIAARDAAFRAELDTATQRLESAQAHMLQQIDAARLGQRRAESQAANLQLRRDQLQSELAELKMQCGVQERSPTRARIKRSPKGPYPNTCRLRAAGRDGLTVAKTVRRTRAIPHAEAFAAPNSSCAIWSGAISRSSAGLVAGIDTAAHQAAL